MILLASRCADANVKHRFTYLTIQQNRPNPLRSGARNITSKWCETEKTWTCQLCHYIRKKKRFVKNKHAVLSNKMSSYISEARLTASYYNCKYVETSASLNHHVDNLLVGILSQIRLKLNPEKLLQKVEQCSNRRTKNRNGSLKTAKGILDKLFNRQKSLSCDHLYDL